MTFTNKTSHQAETCYVMWQIWWHAHQGKVPYQKNNMFTYSVRHGPRRIDTQRDEEDTKVPSFFCEMQEKSSNPM